LAESGFTMVGGTRLFRLVRHPDAKRQFERLARAGIWTRDFPENAGLLRFGNLVSQDFVRVSEALREN
jgi:cobalamin biosynthetic protein CobC